jgi:hypothetical protein
MAYRPHRKAPSNYVRTFNFGGGVRKILKSSKHMHHRTKRAADTKATQMRRRGSYAVVVKIKNKYHIFH